MSVVSKNPFDLLDDDGDSSPAPAAKPTSQTTTAAKKAPNASSGTVQRNVPGSAPRGGSQRGGRYPSRGGPRNIYRDDNGPRNTGPDPASGTAEGMEGPGGFEGERVAPSKKAHQGPDRHTKGPREFRENRRNGDGFGDRRGRGGHRGGRVPTDGGERRHFERRSGGLPDSQKKVDQGWGSNDGPRELDAEEEGEKDAQAEENAPQTPAADDGGWGAADDAPKSAGFGGEAAAEEEPAEPEEVQKSYEEYLAEKAQQALQFGKKEGRQVSSETLEGKAFVREAVDDFFSGKEKNASGKARAPKKEKVFIEVDGQFAAPPRSGRGGDRGGRGGGRGRGGDRGSGRGRGGGAPRGRGGFGGPRQAQGGGLDGSDDRAFPALGA